jgi:multiple sugar transport system permease protein
MTLANPTYDPRGHDAVTAAVSLERQRLGRLVLIAASAIFAIVSLYQTLYTAGLISMGFATWRPVVYSFLLWGAALCVSRVLIYGEGGKRSLFVLPALLFTLALVVFPTIFGLFIAFSDWNLSAFEGRKFNGLANLYQLWHDRYFWNALGNMVFYVASVLVQYAIAFGLALLLNADIKARKFFRVAFLLPFMLSPVAVSWMIGKSLVVAPYGPLVKFAKWLGWASPAFFASPWIAKTSIAVMDAWVWIPFMMILILAGLQALPKDVQEAAKVDGATPWQTFWQITFPLMLPVSLTTIILRIIFQMKLADIVINTTFGGPGGATDTVSSFIFREYRDRSNVGYGTMAAEVYLIIIVVFLMLLLKFAGPYLRRETEP